MKCPVCDVVMKMTHRESVEIDYCPKCRGIWLDRGELDKLIDLSRTSGAYALPPAPDGDGRKRKNDEPRRKDKRGYSDNRRDRYDDDDDDRDRRYKKRRKRDFLEEIFDIFD